MQSRGQNRNREIRLSGIVGGLVETWAMVELGPHLVIERAGMETLNLKQSAPHFYPDYRTPGSARGVPGNRHPYRNSGARGGNKP